MEIQKDREIKILALLKDKNYKPMKIKEIIHFMEVPENERELFRQTVDELVKSGGIIITKKGKVLLPESLSMYKGVFTGHSHGFGFVTPEKADLELNQGQDIFIPANCINGAMNKDLVLCKVTGKSKDDKRAEGEVVQILKRGYTELVGTFQKEKNFGFVTPDDRKIPGDIFIAQNDSKGAVTGHKVMVKITKRGDGNKNAEGKVTEILGHRNDPGVDILSIVKQLNISTDFQPPVFEELERITEAIPEEEIKIRKDLRDWLTITIDGADTKDVDDAVTLKNLSNGNFQLGVHIADVTHYVREGSELDKEAFKRGTSVYLTDRVIPMLPHKLSNGVCSLNPGVDRLALSCIMEINQKGMVVAHEIANTIINVDKPINYDQVFEMLTDEKSPLLEENAAFMPMCRELEALSCILREKRVRRGAIEFDFPECKIVVDESGKPVGIKPYQRNIATSIIEECMLVCNEIIAEEYFWLELPFVFRSHEEPDTEKLKTLSEFVNHFGYRLKGNGMHPGSLQALLSKIETTPEETIISRVMLRSFKQARYTHENMGHFGLAAKYYCHFTSPIRRYPDLQIHRIIKKRLANENSGHMGSQANKEFEMLKERMPDICRQCSVTERVAETCEREVENLKKTEYMADKIGQQFEGIVSGITSWGIYVELPNTIEGMVSLSSMDDDHYIFHKDRMMYVGERLKKIIALGDKVTVVVVRANIEERNLDFVFA